jgi:LmbE family N-acetylglucosaminyl deacetylase
LLILKFVVPTNKLQRINMLKLLPLIFLFATINSFANKPPSEIYQDVLKLHSLKRVLYIAAHPDDENTRALAYFSLGENAETAYLSLTRGDGGQNLIGGELSEDLGVLRTQELLAARSYDKANQFFSRAVDFGYSKTPEETFEKWGKEIILSDVVMVIRKFKPDIIITRFPPDERGGHGHHTASAMLAIEAFEKAADPNYLPEQVREYGIWQTGSVYWNSSSWWDKTLPEKSKNNPKYIVQDIGGYNSLLGMSYNEIGTIARSQHKCQGFGAIIERGSRVEYFEHLIGEKKTDFFEDSRTWESLKGKEVENELKFLLENFDFVNPENNIEQLGKIKKALHKITDEQLKTEKLERIDQIIMACSGLYVDAKLGDYSVSPGDTALIKLNFLSRSKETITINSISNRSAKLTSILYQKIKENENTEIEKKIYIDQSISNPYWLNDPFKNIFTIQSKDIGKAINPASYNFRINLSYKEVSFAIEVPLEFVNRDPAYGERRRDVISTPSYSANFEQKLSIVKPNQEKKIKVKIHSFKDSLDTELKMKIPPGWEVSPQSFHLKSTRKHEEIFVELTLKANSESVRGPLVLTDSEGNQLHSYTEIAYNHIPTQVIFKKSQIECIKLDAKINQGKIAYIKGVKDAVPNGIRELGFDIKEYEVDELADLDLNQFQTVVLGIRIYNVKKELKNFDQKLFTYVEQGGNLIMQYNTASRWVRSQKYGPKPFELGRKRVTDENAEVTFLKPDHAILNSPNKITKEDFKNWVQERGLYFAEKWDKNYQALFSWNDKGEEPVKGALIVLKHGKGQFVYTGISFFRELPNGVEGAFKLFANLLSYKK